MFLQTCWSRKTRTETEEPYCIYIPHSTMKHLISSYRYHWRFALRPLGTTTLLSRTPLGGSPFSNFWYVGTLSESSSTLTLEEPSSKWKLWTYSDRLKFSETLGRIFVQAYICWDNDISITTTTKPSDVFIWISLKKSQGWMTSQEFTQWTHVLTDGSATNAVSKWVSFRKVKPATFSIPTRNTCSNYKAEHLVLLWATEETVLRS